MRGPAWGWPVVLRALWRVTGDGLPWIQVDSEVGQGTTFTIRSSRLPDNAKNPMARSTSRSDLPTGSESILLVDDEAPIAKIEVGQLVLEGLGYSVTTRIQDSVEAFGTVQSKTHGDFDLVITDMTMPGKSGDQLAKELLALRPELPVIICSGFSERASREQAQGIGVRYFLRKPITLFEISHKVRAALDESAEQ